MSDDDSSSNDSDSGDSDAAPDDAEFSQDETVGAVPDDTRIGEYFLYFQIKNIKL